MSAKSKNELSKKPPLTGGFVFLVICAIPIFATLIFGAVSSGTRALLSVLVAVLIVALVIDVWRSGEVKVSSNALQLPLLVLIVLGLVQLLPLGGSADISSILAFSPTNSLSMDPNATRLAILKLATFLLFFSAALVYINSPQRLRSIVFTIIIFAAIMAFIGILQRLASPNFIYGMREVDYANPFASFVNQHHFAAFMEMTIGLTLGLLFGDSVEKDKRLLLIIAVALMGIAIVLTGSRGGFLSLTGVLVFLVLINVSIRKTSGSGSTATVWKSNLVLIGGSAVLMAFLVAAVIWLGQGDSVVRIGGGVNNPNFSNGRIHFWTVSLQMVRDNPFVGVGLEAFGVAFTKYDTWNGGLRVEHAHNDYLQMLTDAGILGFLCVLGFIYLLFKKGMSTVKSAGNLFRRGTAIGSLAGCFGILVHSFFDFPLRTNANMFFFLLLAVLATATIEYPKLYRKPTLIKPKNT